MKNDNTGIHLSKFFVCYSGRVTIYKRFDYTMFQKLKRTQNEHVGGGRAKKAKPDDDEILSDSER